MAEKISYFISSALLLVLLLLPHHSNICHAAEEDSQCGCPDTDLPNNSVNEGSGVGIQFMKSSICGCRSRNTLISGKPMNTVVPAAAVLALYGSTVAVFAYLSANEFAGVCPFSWLQMSLLACVLNPFSMDDFDEYDHIISRRRISSPPTVQGPLGRLCPL